MKTGHLTLVIQAKQTPGYHEVTPGPHTTPTEEKIGGRLGKEVWMSHLDQDLTLGVSQGDNGRGLRNQGIQEISLEIKRYPNS